MIFKEKSYIFFAIKKIFVKFDEQIKDTLKSFSYIQLGICIFVNNKKFF